MTRTNPVSATPPSVTPNTGVPAADGRAQEILLLVAARPVGDFTVIAGRDPRDAVSRLTSLLAYVGATDDEALTVAFDISAQLAGSEVEIEYDINGVVVTVTAEEPDGEDVDVTHLNFDGDCVAEMRTNRCRLVDIAVDRDTVNGYADQG